MPRIKYTIKKLMHQVVFGLAGFVCLALSLAHAQTQHHGQEKVTFEGFALGMPFLLPQCQEHDSTSRCQVLLGDEEVNGHQTQAYQVFLGNEPHDTLSARSFVLVNTIDGAIVQVIIVTGGVDQQKQIYATLVKRLGVADDYYAPQEVDKATPINGLAPESMMVTWVTNEGQINFTGELSKQGYGVIVLQSGGLLSQKF